MRIGTNALFRLARDSIVVRIGLNREAIRSAETEIRVARWLARSRIVACRPVAGIIQPLIVDGYPVTFWDWIETSARNASPAQLGSTLRSLHALGGHDVELDPFDPLASAFVLLRGPLAEDPTLSFLREQCSTLADAFRSLVFELPRGPIHGDAHVGNLMVSDSQAFLIDLETFAVGPREWDLVPTAVQHERFGLSRDAYRAFASAYGFDVRSWSGYAILRRIRELAITAWVGARAGQDGAAATEFRRRIDSLRDGRTARRWRAF